mmetsp:Transcript_50333/g.93064  ORF Transcript_50333/g.93064 Transcript_50333/m.93064 type:complete len:224 (-) Transcript_50333:16-687(-)
MGSLFATPTELRAEADVSERRGGKKLLIAVSGKRASGKDYLSTLILEEVQKKIAGVKLKRLAFADQCKHEFAAREGLEVEKLLGDREYKEKHRARMTEFYLQTVASDPKHFIASVVDAARCFFIDSGDAPALCVISDLRHAAEVPYVRSAEMRELTDAIILTRVHADDEIRRQRGWEPDAEKDSSSTECDLDTFQSFAWVLENHDANLVLQEVQRRVLSVYQT